MKEFLTPKETAELRRTLDNKPLLNGLKKVFLFALYSGTLERDVVPEPRRNFICDLLYSPDMAMDYDLDNERLGAKVRASVEGIRAIEQGFKSLEGLREIKADKEEAKKNPGR